MAADDDDRAAENGGASSEEDIAKLKQEVALKQEELDFQRARLQTNPDHPVLSAAVERLKEELEECRAAERSAKPIYQQMVGKC